MKIRQLGDPILREKAKPVKKFGKNLSRLVKVMLDTMKEHGGVGLAAPQVGVSERVIIVGNNSPLFLVNPKITKWGTDWAFSKEGCLSCPNFETSVLRCTAITVEYYALSGRKVIINPTNEIAFIIQHEIDHLDGRLIVDIPTNA